MAHLAICKVTPLIEISEPTFFNQYERGLAWSRFYAEKGTTPLDDGYFLNAFETSRAAAWYDGRHEQTLYWWFGFILGVIHSATIDPLTNATYPDIPGLVLLHNCNVKRGYQAGRQFWFYESPDGRRHSDYYIITWFKELAREATCPQSRPRTIHFCLGTLLGELSVHLFPVTPQEYGTWQAEERETERRMQEQTAHISLFSDDDSSLTITAMGARSRARSHVLTPQ